MKIKKQNIDANIEISSNLNAVFGLYLTWKYSEYNPPKEGSKITWINNKEFKKLIFKLKVLEKRKKPKAPNIDKPI